MDSIIFFPGFVESPPVTTPSVPGINLPPEPPLLENVAEYLQNVEYPFLYYCQSTPPKSNSTFNRGNAEHIMKMKLGQYFMNKGYYFQKVSFKEDTELIISNRQYKADNQFQWLSFEQKII